MFKIKILENMLVGIHEKEVNNFIKDIKKVINITTSHTLREGHEFEDLYVTTIFYEEE